MQRKAIATNNKTSNTLAVNASRVPRAAVPVPDKNKLVVPTAAKARAVSQAPIKAKAPLHVGSEIVSKAERLVALGNTRACNDKCLQHILDNSEKLFMPKKIHESGDWLMSHKEKDQTFDKYDQTGVKNLVTEQRNKIYIFVIDPSITPDFTDKLRRYCAAFYTDMDVQIKMPKSADFLKTLDVPNRMNGGQRQYNANVILKKTLP